MWIYLLLTTEWVYYSGRAQDYKSRHIYSFLTRYSPKLRHCLEVDSVQRKELAGGPLYWNRPPAQAGTREEEVKKVTTNLRSSLTMKSFIDHETCLQSHEFNIECHRAGDKSSKVTRHTLSVTSSSQENDSLTLTWLLCESYKYYLTRLE